MIIRDIYRAWSSLLMANECKVHPCPKLLWLEGEMEPLDFIN
jgi:hypothetical protein